MILHNSEINRNKNGKTLSQNKYRPQNNNQNNNQILPNIREINFNPFPGIFWSFFLFFHL